MNEEQTLSIIKPNAVRNKKIGEIISIFEKNNLTIKRAKLKTLNKNEAEAFYKEHKGRPFFDELVGFMTSGPIMILILGGDNAVEVNRRLMGATNPAEAEDGTIRSLYADSMTENAVHGSDSQKSANSEIAFFFDE
tara:strand:+ start:315 stop:722 length:408 start_codon:yes stop_codon:yes gene_type:complete